MPQAFALRPMQYLIWSSRCEVGAGRRQNGLWGHRCPCGARVQSSPVSGTQSQTQVVVKESLAQLGRVVQIGKAD